MSDHDHPQSAILDIPAEDIERCHAIIGEASWRELKGQRIFVTGGTGFIGKWLLATLLDAKEKLCLECDITVLSRDPSKFKLEWPSIAAKVDWIKGDIRDFATNSEYFDVIVHAATDVFAQSNPQDIFFTCLEGTRRVMNLAQRCDATRLLFVSSGAVYGPPPPGITHIPETYLGGPDQLLAASAYAEGKRASEWLVANMGRDMVNVKIARVFAIVGPHLPLDMHFAIGNFLRDAMLDEEIVIQGDGTPHRSFLYAADMAAWLWTILLRGDPGRVYNVGADESLSISDLATRICLLLNRTPRLLVREKASLYEPVKHYVPDISRALKELGLPSPMSLDEAILRSANWYITRPQPSPAERSSPYGDSQ